MVGLLHRRSLPRASGQMPREAALAVSARRRHPIISSASNGSTVVSVSAAREVALERQVVGHRAAELLEHRRNA